MVTVHPFAALRPKAELALQVSALPYDVMNHQEAKNMAQDNAQSFLHISRSDIDLESEKQIHDPIAYQTALNNLKKFETEGTLQRDPQPEFYLYRQIMNGRSQTGLVACVSVDEYLNNTIKKHELTRKEKELDRIQHFFTCSAQTEPIFLAYRQNLQLTTIFTQWQKQHQAEYHFTSEDGIQHTLWQINDSSLINQIQAIFENIPNLYIADGHHRAASGAEVCQRKRQENPQFTGQEEFNFIMAVLFPDEDLMIMDYNRVIADLNHLSSKDFLSKISEVFEVTPCSEKSPYAPKQTHEFGMYLDHQWYCCRVKKAFYQDADPINRLDCAILQNFILGPILGITDPRTDKRIDFIGGIRGLKELERRCKNDMQLAFSLYPVSMKELFTVADAGMIMPPKSTWFEPKLRSGLFVHTF